MGVWWLVGGGGVRLWAAGRAEAEAKMWSLRAVIESAVHHGRRVLEAQRRQINQVQQSQQSARPPDARHKLSKWQSEGGPGVSRSAAECAGEGQACAGVSTGLSVPANGLVSRWVQGLVRKVSAPLWAEAKRSTTKRLVFGESAPYFALVGVTLVSGSQLGLVTKEDELEALCCNIREAISRAGWLHNPEYWQHQKDLKEGKDESFEEFEAEHVFSLTDFVLGPVIDKGCSAVVYAAKWNADEPEVKDFASQPLKRQRSESPIRPLEQHEVVMQDEQMASFFVPVTEEVESFSGSDESRMNLDREFSLTDLRQIDIDELSVELEAESLACNTQKPQDHTKRVKFKTEEKSSSNMKRTLTMESVQGAVASPTTTHHESAVVKEKTNIQEYPLAVKMMFNYEAESNAPAILRAMYKEMIPARSLQLDEEQIEWQERFCSKHMNLPPHPNIVEMPCVFVDRIPFLEDSMHLYPDALPARINPRGYGRNMSLFCVMKRYDMSLREYLTRHTPPDHTSLLLLTQLLEAVLHINNHNVAHRDLKSDNILLSLAEGEQYPLLVLTDFGCSVTTDSSNMTVPFPSRESDPRQGNAALMAPEVKTATPGLLRSVNFTHSDLWAVGALAYEIYGLENPFCGSQQNTLGNRPKYLDSATYKESQLPRLPKCVPSSVKHLIHDLLRRNPRNRPSVNIAATLCQLILWAPSKWLSRRALTLPTHTEIMQWLLCLTTKVLCEARLSRTHSTDGKKNVGQRRRMEEMRGGASDRQGGQLEYELVSTFLARVHYMDIIQAIKWNRAF